MEGNGNEGGLIFFVIFRYRCEILC